MLLNDQITKKATQSRQEAKSFETSLASEFRSLTVKSGENLNKVNDQVDLLIRQAELENEMANRVAKLSAMFSKTALLERLVYSKINEKLDTFPKKEVEEKSQAKSQSNPAQSTEKNTKENTRTPRFKIPFLPQRKLAEGGIVPPSGFDTSNKFNSVAIPYAKTLSLSLQASGISAISFLGEFIKGTGSLGAFFAPYLKSVVKPFALALGVDSGMINKLVSEPVRRASIRLQDDKKYFTKVWGKFLNDDNFVSKFIDRSLDNLAGADPNNPPGYVPADWKEDPEFVALVNEFAKEWNLNANGLLALMASESGLRPHAENSDGCVGLIQFCPGGGLGGTGKTAAELKAMTRSQQWPYVVNYWVKSGLEKGMTAGDIYGLTHVPNWYKRAVKGKAVGSAERMNAVVATSADGGAYSRNKRLDFNQDGKITVADYDNEVARKGKEHKINYQPYKFESGGGNFFSNDLTPLTPYLLSGSDSGYDVVIQGQRITMHGDEIVVPFSSGFQVYPVKNRRYDITKKPEEVFDRWKQISRGDDSNSIASAQSGGTKRSVSSLAKDYKYWELFYARQAAYSQIGTKRQGSSGTGYAPSVVSRWNNKKSSSSNVARSILKKSQPIEAPKTLVKTETDIMMDEYKALVAAGKHSEAKDLGMKIWNKTWRKTNKGLERIPETPAPKATSSGDFVSASPVTTPPKVVINQAGGGESSPSVSPATSSKNTVIQLEVINYHKFRTELNMRRAR